jgi:hypothetical protein
MRFTIDKLLSWFGVILAVAMLIVGGLATWASSFIGSQVKEQFSMQEIVMPDKDTIQTEEYSKADQDALMPFAGKPLLTGPAAKAYANHYILVHMNASGVALLKQAADLGITTLADGSPMPEKMTYSNASRIAGAVTAAAAKESGAADPATYKCATGDAAPSADSKEGQLCALAANVSATRMSSFLNGNTLRGLLLYGYAFATMGTLAGYAAILAFIGAAVMIVLAVLGFRHASTTRKQEIRA